MPAFDPTFDYFDLVGVTPPKALSEPVAQLRQRVLEQKRIWSGKEQNPKYQQEARAAKERLLQFEQLLRDPDALVAYAHFQTQQRAARRAEQESEIARLVTAAQAGRKTITAKQKAILNREAGERKIPADIVDAVLRRLGIAVTDSAPADKPVVPRLSDALDPAVMSELHNWLGVLGKPNLYALLDLPEGTAPADLVAMAKSLYARWSKMLPKTSECTAWEKTTLACFTYLRDAAGKARYNRALFNLRIDQFIKRVDLVLAGESVGPAERESLTRVGVTEFGLAEKTVEECIRARAAELGDNFSSHESVTVNLTGQTRCRFCFAWNPATGRTTCRNCDCLLRGGCKNPTCRAPATDDSLACPRCRLPHAKGKLYASVIALADTCLDTGLVEEAVTACGLAEQLLPGPEIAKRLARAQQIRTLLTSAGQAVARKRWSQVLRELTRLLQLAPRLRRPGIPQLEVVSDYVRAARAKLDAVGEHADPLDVAKVARSCLTQWADCDVAYQRLRTAAEALLNGGRFAVARLLAEKILASSSHAGDASLLGFATEVQQKADRMAGTTRDAAAKPNAGPPPAGTAGTVVPWWADSVTTAELVKA